MNRDLEGLRRDYQVGQLLEEDAGADPISLFGAWLSDAKKTTQLEPNAMTLATIDGKGNPHARIVLLKGQVGRDFNFYTNYLSHKAEELLASPSAALVFWWDQLERQVRVEGSVEKLGDEANDAYFRERPKGSRLGAWASQQSQVIESHDVLTEKLDIQKEVLDAANEKLTFYLENEKLEILGFEMSMDLIYNIVVLFGTLVIGIIQV